MSLTPEWVSAVASCVAAVGIAFAYGQLRLSRSVAQAQFEDGLAKEYRELATKIPTNALLGDALSDEEHRRTFDEFFRYIDLSNEQVSLRRRGRIGAEAWQSWSAGIQWNLSMPSFARAWAEIKLRSTAFSELRRLEREKFEQDPRSWR